MKFKIVFFVSFLLLFVYSTSLAVTNEVDRNRNERERKRDLRPRLEHNDATSYREKMRKERERKRERAPRLEQQDDTAVAAETSEAVDELTAEGSAVEVKEVTGIELSAEGSAVEVKEVTGIELSAEGSGT
ncbi:MAG: hypothetical protein F3741_08620 [Nitrospinae bacterium]|nr:hypothetical protein [Nitrospinota bacterium]